MHIHTLAAMIRGGFGDTLYDSAFDSAARPGRHVLARSAASRIYEIEPLQGFCVSLQLIESPH